MIYAAIGTTVALEDLDITGDGAAEVSVEGDWLELVIPTALGALGGLTVRMPADVLRAALGV